MRDLNGYIETLLLIILGVLLLWFGYALFSFIRKGRKPIPPPQPKETPQAAGNRTCPLCFIRLEPGEQVKSSAFAATESQGSDRLMHIFGCPHCLGGERKRICPVCGAVFRPQDHLIARYFDKPGRSHVHVLGCTQCRHGGLRGPHHPHGRARPAPLN